MRGGGEDVGKVAHLPVRIPIKARPEVSVPLEAVIRADLNPAMRYTCVRLIEDGKLLDEVTELSLKIAKVMDGRDVAVMLAALYSCVEMVSSSWLSTEFGRRFAECSTGSSARPKSGASTPSPWLRPLFCLSWLWSKLSSRFSSGKKQPAP